MEAASMYSLRSRGSWPLISTCARSALTNARRPQSANMRHWKLPTCNRFPERHSSFFHHQDVLRGTNQLHDWCDLAQEQSKLPASHFLGTSFAWGARQSRRVACSIAKWHMDASAAFPAFVQLNCGTWSGTFYQFNAFGKVLESIQTTMEVTSSGTADDLMMQQRLKVQDQAVGAASASDSESVFDLHSSRTSLGDSQQLSYFPGDGAFSLSHQTAEALDALLRKGLSKKKDGEHIDRTVRYPSERPALVSECCLHSDSGDRRVRAIHVLDTRGLLDQIGVFVESKTEGEELETQDDPGSRIDALLGKWKGRASSRRTALYGGTVTEYDSSITYTKGPEGTLEQVLKMGPSGFELKSTASLDGSVILYPGGLQTTLLPGGIAVTCPLNVKPGQSFYFEMSWIVNPGHRSRLIRTYDLDGLVVSTTLIKEVKS